MEQLRLVCYALTMQSPEFAMQRRNDCSEQPQPCGSSLHGISSHFISDKLEADTHEHDAQLPVCRHDARLERTRRPFGASRKLYFEKHVSGSVLVVFVSGVSGR